MSEAESQSHGNTLGARIKSLFVLPEKSESSPGGYSRRDFLLAAGFSFAGACVTGCYRAPPQAAIPLLYQPEGVIPGVARYYASTCEACSAACGILAKNNDGRPTKLEGNPDHPLSKGGLCAAGQASILGLYDRQRLQHPLKAAKKSSWDEIDADLTARLDAIKRKGETVRILSKSLTSPTSRQSIERFVREFANASHVTYDANSCSAILDAHKLTHGVRVLPRYHLDRANVIVGLDADFLGTWISPVEFTRAYQNGRQLTGKEPRLSQHVQIESQLTLTGSKADQRVCLAPHEIRTLLQNMAAKLGRLAGIELNGTNNEGRHSSAEVEAVSKKLTDRLWKARGRSLVLCGSQDIPSQVLCNFINHVLNSYGATLDIEHPSYQRMGSDQDLKKLLAEIQAGKVAALFVLDCNPIGDLPDADAFIQFLKQIPLVVCCNQQLDETARTAHYVCPQPHYLESWSDFEPVSGVLSLSQPNVPRLGDTRSICESLSAWMGKPKSAYDLIRERWQAEVFPRQNKQKDFQSFWEHAVHDGFAEVSGIPLKAAPLDIGAVHKAMESQPVQNSGRVLVLYPKVGIPDGSHAYNPWLQELPDPISKVTWDNYASLGPATALELGVREGDVVRVENSAGKGIELPVFVQPGQHESVVAVALGYGRIVSERFAGIGPQWLEAKPTLGENGLVGRNASPLLDWDADTLRYAGSGVKLVKTHAKHVLASTQTHYALSVPEHLANGHTEFKLPIQEIALGAIMGHATGETKSREDREELWAADHPYSGHRWGMVIDLQACTGCSACVIACQSENNIPVVGRDEVARRREMQWLRIDRYYSENASGLKVDFQPMLCQHCENAPCETVCPVLATVHSSEGLNVQVYNRCVGTRYCANNCPYKVRRFNWFAYAHEDSLQNLALNPEVTVRSRGVMEKCTFCVQRIEGAKIDAKQRGVELQDGDLQTACQQSCPARAIVFGDLHNAKSEVARLQQDPRKYHALEELNIGPSVAYLKVVRDSQGAESESTSG
jgi:molybdopterin-containing oxidoreductase family iron-sulfur binding subunit